jgi:general stress protein YciG
MKAPKGAREYLASIGSKGGKATGKSKVRGDTDYYKRISAKAAKARKAKRATDRNKVKP